MKKQALIIVSLIVISCSSTQLVESWKNPDIATYEPNKVLIVGLTSDQVARQQFENKLKNELQLRGYEAAMSSDIFKNSLNTVRMTEAELDDLENQLVADDFDTILLTKIIGVDDKIAYRKNYSGYDETYRKFKEDYLMYQDIYYNPDYYDDYVIYHAETSMYCICQTKDRELLWKGYINITDPRSIEKTVNEYATLVLIALEEEHIIKPKTL
jgi:hypothetical protein